MEAGRDAQRAQFGGETLGHVQLAAIAQRHRAAGTGEFAGHALPDAAAGTADHAGPCRKIRCHIRLSRLPGRWLAPPVA